MQWCCPLLQIAVTLIRLSVFMYLFHFFLSSFFLYQRNDIAMAITKFDQFDFLIDIVPRDDLKPPKRQVGTQEKCFIIEVKSSKKPSDCLYDPEEEELYATPLLGVWRCCKHPWLEARCKASEGFQSDVCSVLLPLTVHAIIAINTKSPHWPPDHVFPQETSPQLQLKFSVRRPQLAVLSLISMADVIRQFLVPLSCLHVSRCVNILHSQLWHYKAGRGVFTLFLTN